ncbi:MAG: helix-turn-helix domain-containing protein [Alphaproteobacteria bacterium]
MSQVNEKRHRLDQSPAWRGCAAPPRKREQQAEMFTPAEAGLHRAPKRITCGRLSLAQIVTAVSQVMLIAEREIRGPRRDRPIAAARHMAVYLARSLTDQSYPMIGHGLGGRYHTTVMSSMQRMTARIENDAQISRLAQRCMRHALSLAAQENYHE